METLTIHADISEAETLPTDFYTDHRYYKQAKEKIFARSWQFCLDHETLQVPGSAVPHTLLPGLLDEPLLFTRDSDDQLRCLSNVCTHRGNLLVDGICNLTQIRCRYHGRRFNLSGGFMHMPEFQAAKNFPTERDNLPKIPFGQLGPFLFAALDPRVSFDAVFAPIQSRLNWLPWHLLRFDAKRSRDYLVKAHWALYCENYLEGLHIPFVHPALRSTLDFQNYTTEIFPYCNLQFALASNGEMAFDLPPESPDYGKRVAAYYFWIFPNIMLNFYPWGCSVNVIKPMGPELTKVSFISYVMDESKIGQGAGGELDRVEREDEAVVESVQQGIRSRFYRTGRYSPSMEQGTHHFHQLICEFMQN